MIFVAFLSVGWSWRCWRYNVPLFYANISPQSLDVQSLTYIACVRLFFTLFINAHSTVCLGTTCPHPIIRSLLQNLGWRICSGAHTYCLVLEPSGERERRGGGPVIWVRNTTVTKIVMILDFSSWAVLVCWIANVHFKCFPHTYLTDCAKWLFVWWCNWPPPLLFLRKHLLELKSVNKQGSLSARKLTHFSAQNALVLNPSPVFVKWEGWGKWLNCPAGHLLTHVFSLFQPELKEVIDVQRDLCFHSLRNLQR